MTVAIWLLEYEESENIDLLHLKLQPKISSKFGASQVSKHSLDPLS